MRHVALLILLFPVLVSAEESGESGDPALAPLEWRCIGPYRGGRSTAVSGVPGSATRFYFGASGGGLWRTDDGGTTWDNISDGHFQSGSVGAIAVAEAAPSVVYVGMGEGPIRGVASPYGDGVYRSDDGGRTWHHLGLERARQIGRIVVDPRDPMRVYVAAQGDRWRDTPERGVYRSNDGGQSWQRVLFVDERTGASDLSIDARDPSVLYAGMWSHRRRPWFVESGGEAGGVYRSTDGGDTWTRLGGGLPEFAGKVGVACSPASPERVYALVEAEEGGLFRSDDAGDTWRLVNGDRVLRARSWYYMHVVADPVDADTVYVMNAPLLRSRDGGETFTRVPTPHGDNHDLWIDPVDPRRMINANDGGGCVSYNGGETWSTQNNQPTAQFYRVTTDATFPYRVYGGQQDNSTVSIASRTAGGGIGRGDWHAVSGCECAFIAFDEDDPRFIYAGCYQGIIEEYDATTGAVRGVAAWPDLGLGADSSRQRYRHNWNAPIVVSRHDAKTIYHAAQLLKRSTNRGRSWVEISPDLTRDEEDKQGAGGGPITNEGAGGEVYGTISYVAESRHDAGELWVGTDDGLVHLTRDAGASWREVTPVGLRETLVNCIELSPHEPGVAYVVTTRHRFGDFTPNIMRTRDYGATWQRIVEGIEDEDFARAVREDPGRRGLLYAGTESGVWVSFDDGDHWRSLRQNLPVVPVTDLAVRDGDLVASTQGRAFWILDDITPLRAIDVDAEMETAVLPARPYAILASGGGSPGPNPGKNAPAGTTIHYVLSHEDADAGDVRVDVIDKSGTVVRTIEREPKEPDEAGDADGDGPEDGGGPTADHGLNRLVWDLRTDEVTKLDGQHHYGSRDGYRVAPGEYTVRLTVGDRAMETALLVRDDPRVARPASVFAERSERLASLRAAVDGLHRSWNDASRMRAQVEAAVARAEGRPGEGEIRARGEALIAALTAWQEGVVQPKQETFQDVINFENLLNARMLHLMAELDQSSPPLNAGARELHDALLEESSRRRDEFADLVEGDVRSFNALVAGWHVPAVAPPAGD